MAERITRPPIRLAGGLPDGNLSNVGDHAGRLLADEPELVYFVGAAGRKQLIHQDDQDGAELAIIKVKALEVLEKLPSFAAAGMDMAEFVRAVRADRTGDNALEIDGSANEEYAHLAELRRQLAEYAAEQGMSDVEVGKDVMATVPGAGTGWRDSPQILGEYLRTKGVLADPPAGGKS